MTFIEFHKKNKRKIIYCNLLFIIAAAFITQSRGWVLQTLVLLFVFVAVLGNRNRYVKFLMGLLLIFIAILGVSYVFPEITGNLFNRGVEDTRSGQYVIFFAQHSWKDLILGLGINASYKIHMFYPSCRIFSINTGVFSGCPYYIPLPHKTHAPSLCQLRNNFFSKISHKAQYYQLTLKISTKKEPLISQKSQTLRFYLYSISPNCTILA